MSLADSSQLDISPANGGHNPVIRLNSRLEKALLIIATVIVCASVLFRAWTALEPYLITPMHDLHKDIDWGYLNGGLNKVHCFRDTARWWTGTWCGQVPFWRPLTSYALWGMRLLWPAEYMLPRQIILVFLHLCFTGCATALLWKLTRRPWLALLSLFLFAGYRQFQAFDPQAFVRPVNDVLMDPKNISDPLVGLAIIGSLLFLTNGKWIAALILAAVSVGFKENGFTTWPIAAVMLGWIHRERVLAPGGIGYILTGIKRNKAPVAICAATMLALLVVHFATVGIGYREGSNDFWTWRIAVFFDCPALSNLILFDHTAGVMSMLLFGAVVLSWRKRFFIKFLFLVAAVALGILIDSWMQRTSWEISATRILAQGQGLDTTLLGFLWFAVVVISYRDWRHVVFGASMALIAAAPSWMAAQAWAHTRYTASVFMAMATSAVIIQCIATIYGVLRKSRRTHGSASA